MDLTPNHFIIRIPPQLLNEPLQYIPYEFRQILALYTVNMVLAGMYNGEYSNVVDEVEYYLEELNNATNIEIPPEYYSVDLETPLYNYFDDLHLMYMAPLESQLEFYLSLGMTQSQREVFITRHPYLIVYCTSINYEVGLLDIMVDIGNV